jgi:hypothetical protein
MQDQDLASNLDGDGKVLAPPDSERRLGFVMDEQQKL